MHGYWLNNHSFKLLIFLALCISLHQKLIDESANT